MSCSVARDKGFFLSLSFSLSANIFFSRARALGERERREAEYIQRVSSLSVPWKCQVVRARSKHASLKATSAPDIRDSTDRKARCPLSIILPAKERTIPVVGGRDRSVFFSFFFQNHMLLAKPFSVSSRKCLLFKITSTSLTRRGIKLSYP